MVPQKWLTNFPCLQISTHIFDPYLPRIFLLYPDESHPSTPRCPWSTKRQRPPWCQQWSQHPSLRGQEAAPSNGPCPGYPGLFIWVSSYSAGEFAANDGIGTGVPFSSRCLIPRAWVPRDPRVCGPYQSKEKWYKMGSHIQQRVALLISGDSNAYHTWLARVMYMLHMCSYSASQGTTPAGCSQLPMQQLPA